MKKIFLSGAMTGVPDYNRPLFFKVEKMINELTDNIVLNPAVLPIGMKHKDYMKICFAMIDVSDEVLFLEGYQESKGSMEELEYAKEKGKDLWEIKRDLEITDEEMYLLEMIN